MTQGNAGESHVEYLATMAGFTVNRVSRDSAGWDHVFDLQMPDDSRLNGPLGLPVLITARVQVKTTRSDRKSIPIKLSNWRFAIDDPLPWFFVIVRMSASGRQNHRVSVVHLNKALVTSVQKRLHEIGSGGKKTLNRKTMALSWSGSDVLEPPCDSALREFILDKIPKDLHAYASEKRNWHETAGYEGGNAAKTTFEVRAGSEAELYEQLSEAAVGLRRSIPVMNFRVSRRRFGRDFPDPEIPSSETAKLELGESPTDLDWKMEVLNEHGSQVVCVPVSMRFSGAVFPVIPQDYWMIRVWRPYLDLIQRYKEKSVSITLTLPPMEEPIAVKDLLNSIELLIALGSSQQQRRTIRLTRGNTSAELGEISATNTIDQAVFKLADDLKALCKLATTLNISEFFKMSLSSIDGCRAIVMMLLNLRSAIPVAMNLSMDFDKSIVKPGQEVAFISDHGLVIEGVAYIDIVLFKARAEVEPMSDGLVKVKMTSNDICSIGSFSYPVKDIHKLPFDKIVEKQELLLKDVGIDVVFTGRYGPKSV